MRKESIQAWPPSDDAIIVEITMLPGKIKIHGFKPSGEPKLVLVQKIAKEKAE